VLVVLVLSGALARLYQIDVPLIDAHSFRQCDTAAIARNFHEESLNILYPRIDWRGNSAGYVESEFPIYTVLVALLYRTFGLHEWLGRALNVILYVLSSVVLFCLVGRLLDQRAALLALLFYSCAPLSFVFTRSFQPDALMALCSLSGIY